MSRTLLSCCFLWRDGEGDDSSDLHTRSQHWEREVDLSWLHDESLGLGAVFHPLVLAPPVIIPTTPKSALRFLALWEGGLGRDPNKFLGSNYGYLSALPQGTLKSQDTVC
jgi:hypothetical protein